MPPLRLLKINELVLIPMLLLGTSPPTIVAVPPKLTVHALFVLVLSSKSSKQLASFVTVKGAFPELGETLANALGDWLLCSSSSTAIVLEVEINPEIPVMNENRVSFP